MVFSIFRKSLFLLLFFSFCLKGFGQSLDYRILQSVHVKREKSLDLFFYRSSQSADFVALGYPIGLGIGAIFSKDSSLKWKSLEAGLGLGLAAIFTFGLKQTIQRKRPFKVYSDIKPPFPPSSSYSFPSGTSSLAFETATMMALQFRDWKIWIPAYIWAGTIAYSRMHLGEHYPSDVISGALLGVGSAWLSFELGKWVNSRNKKLVPKP
jgi:membrane-associated phospholipid phosphatase